MQIKRLQALHNCTPADDSVIEDLLVALRGSAEHTEQCGTLMAFVAQCQTAYTQLHGNQSTCQELAPDIGFEPTTLVVM